MITYKSILADQKVIDEYAKIDAQNIYPFSHGLQHAKNVAEMMGDIADTLGIVGDQREYLQIACALHDIGQVSGRENHEFRAKLFSQDYLQGKIPQAGLNEILLAIEKHDQETDLDQLSMFSNLVCFADKMDFSQKRLEKDYEKKFGYLIYSDIVEIGFEYGDDCFKILIITNGISNAIELLQERSFFKKVIKSGIAMSKKLKASCQILVDQKEVDISSYV